MKSLVFLPVFNQIQELPRVLDELGRHCPAGVDVLLVNNGSSDGSAELCRSSPYKVLEIRKNLGVGYSIIRSIDYALEHGYDILCGMASNGKMLAEELPKLIDPIASGEFDYVTGSRFLPGGDSPNLPTFRQVTIPLVSLFARVFTGAKLTDATCGFRAMRVDLMRRAAFDWHAEWLHTYSFEYYLYAKVILNRRIRWCEVPITMRYPPRGNRYTKIRPGFDWWAMMRPWIWARINRGGFNPV